MAVTSTLTGDRAWARTAHSAPVSVHSGRSARYTTRSANPASALASLARYVPSAPTPTTSGLPSRAPTISPGSARAITATP